MEDIKGTSQITPDGIPNNSDLDFIPTHFSLQPINLKPQKGSQSQKRMTKDGDGFSQLSLLYKIALAPDGKLLSPIPSVQRKVKREIPLTTL